MCHLRALLIVLLAALAALGFLLFGLLVGFFLLFGGTTVEEELQRVTSPDGATEAVLMYEGGGGAASWPYRGLYITQAGAESKEGELVILSSRLEGEARLRWQSDKLLEVGTASDPSEIDTPFQYVPGWRMSEAKNTRSSSCR